MIIISFTQWQHAQHCCCLMIMISIFSAALPPPPPPRGSPKPTHTHSQPASQPACSMKQLGPQCSQNSMLLHWQGRACAPAQCETKQ